MTSFRVRTLEEISRCREARGQEDGEFTVNKSKPLTPHVAEMQSTALSSLHYQLN